MNPVQTILQKYGIYLRVEERGVKDTRWYIVVLCSKDGRELEYGNLVMSEPVLEDAYAYFPQSLFMWWSKDSRDKYTSTINKKKSWDAQLELIFFLGQECVDELLAYQETIYQQNRVKSS